MSKPLIPVIKIHKTKVDTRKDLFYFFITFTSNGEN